MLCLCLLLIALIPAAAQADEAISVPGAGAGQTQEPVALATDETNGRLFVADRGNRRIDVFDTSGTFIRAFGWGVVASGPGNVPRNDIQETDVNATGGSFSLVFVLNGFGNVGRLETVTIPFDATAATVQAALEGLSAIGPGDVVVSGPAGGPWTIEFKGAYADVDVLQLEEGAASDLTGGTGELEISTLQPGANYEVCEAADGDVCREGQRGVLTGQLSPSSVAVDPSTGDVYVFDGLETASAEKLPNNRVQKFTAEGEFIYMLGGGVNLDTGEDICTGTSGDNCGRGEKGTAIGEFNAASSAIAVGPGGVLYVNDGGRVQKFTSSGTFIEQVSLPGIESRQLAVDSAGNIYGVAAELEIRKYDPSGTLLDTVSANFINAITIDSSDNLYAATRESGRPGISRYDSSLNLNLIFYNSLVGPLRPPERALSPAPGGVFTVNGEPVMFVELPTPGPVVYPLSETNFADPIGNVRATLHAEINPEGKATTFHFEYIEQAAFESSGGWSSPEVKETPESGSIGADFLLHEVQAAIGCANPQTETSSCLTPDTEYRFRVVATNADGTNTGPDALFTTKLPVEFGNLWTTDVDTDFATVHGEVNPLGFPTTGYFEVVTQQAFQESGFATATKVPAGTPLDFGSGEALVEQSAAVSGLQPSTTYRYRLVASNNCKPLEPTVVCTSESDFESSPPTFTTFALPTSSNATCANAAFRSGTAAFLPDCRGYEMVSPVDKNGANIETGFNFTNYPAALDQSAEDGQSVTYSAYVSFDDPEGSPFSSQYISRRGSSSWSTKSISPPREGPMIFEPEAIDFQFKGFTEDLCSGWVRQDTAKPLLAPKAIPGYENIYRRDNCDPGSGSWEGVTSTEVAVPATNRTFSPQLEGFSADGSKTVFSAIEKLTANAKAGKRQAYEVVNEELELVCILPNNSVALQGCNLGSGPSSAERERSLFNAVSDDGSRVFWNTGNRIYVRIDGGTPEAKTVAVSQVVSNDPAFFHGAAADGSKAVFTIGNGLYEFDVDGNTATQVADGVRGVAGISEDASRIYFVSDQALAPGAEAGDANLYLTEAGEETFIAALPSLGLLSPIAEEPFRRTSRVTPDGQRIVFMSSGSQTGYDNTDAVSGEKDQEVFLFDATAEGGAGRLVCVSCNPTGSRPEGRSIDLLGTHDFWVAATIPTWNSQLSAPRVLSDDGSRVFFNSYERLVSQDSNGKVDAYQWERLGAGDCKEISYTYSSAAAGCISLISSGQSDEDSFYVDSSASGNDVFFKTYSSLVPQDPMFVDIYDARVGGGFATPPPAPDCDPNAVGTSAACQLPPPPPAALSPASQVPGPGNPPRSKKPKKCPKGKHKVKRKGKIVCVKNKKKQGKRTSGRAGR